MKVCTKDLNHTPHADNDRFCYKCGSSLADATKCECGRSLSRYDLFCPNCGKKVGHQT
jgi:predicted amidophosphoribosyltransferase